jgi:streptogrisin B
MRTRRACRTEEEFVRRRRRGIGRGIGTVATLVAALLLAPAAARASRAEVTLQRVAGALGGVPVTGTAWVADPRSATVTLLADRTVTGARLDRIATALRPYGDAVRLRRVDGTLNVRMSGGDPVFGGTARCTAAANVTAGGTYYFLTSGHCGSVASSWYTAAKALIGTTAGSSFPGNDYAIVRYTGNVTHEGTVGSQDITSAGNAYVGEHVCMRGGVSGVHCGTVLGLNATVNYANGVVYGLIYTNICSEPGDSGSPLYDGTRLLGILSGGSGNCTSGGVSYFQPIGEVLAAYGVSVY